MERTANSDKSSVATSGTTGGTTVDLRQKLQEEFVRRCRLNPAYSMRGFAVFLGIDQSLLSKIMTGSRRISKENHERFRLKLGLKRSDITVQAATAAPLSEKYLLMSDDEFSIIADWYHFAILELSKTKGFKAEPTWIAKRLGIHVEEARAAIDRLRRSGRVRFEKGVWTLNAPNNTWSDAKTSEARKSLQRDLIAKSAKALETVPVELRETGSLTVAIDKARLPEFKKRLREVRLELGEFFQSDSNLNEVYQLTVSFFPVSKIKGVSS